MKEFFKFMARFAAPYKWNIVLSVIFNLLTAALTIFSFATIMPILRILFGLDTQEYHYMAIGSASLVDVLTNNFYYYVSRMIVERGGSDTLFFLCATLSGMTLLKVLSAYTSEWFTIPMQNGVTRDIRNDMYAKLLSLPIGFFTNEKKGDIMARMSGDVMEVQVSVMASIFSLLKYPLLIICYVGTMIAISWKITLLVLILLPVLGGLIGLVGRKLKQQNLAGQVRFGSILSNIEETIGGLRIVKAFNAEEQMERKFQYETQDLYGIYNRMQRRYVLAHPLSEFLGTVAVAVILWVGGTLIMSGNSSMDASQFILFMVIFYSVIQPAKELSKTSYTVQKGMAAMERIDKILGADNPIKDAAEPKELPAGCANSSVTLKDVSFSYDGERDVLSHIDLEVNPGETVAIVGQSGSGKSTLVDLIPRFWDVDRGAVMVDGINVKDLRVKDLRSLMGNVNQEAILFNDTIYNNIAFGDKNATREEVETAARIANAHDFIMQTENGYDTLIGDRGCRLSGGQRQRISIARAILKNPSILILDEATSALDTESERLVQDALEKLMKNRTTIVIAHRLSTIVNADRIYVLHEGKVKEVGNHEELIAKGGIYNKLVEMQQV
ncbi:MAG: ABC transporter ATP-binding protein/permease [Muribaculaceae bacterium]|nr:ABC transporter ATP-binding protein [Bacteroides sp.]MDE6071105.1 ABC transporter ATP-binding protein/permease [Muribaculaceae bacterium]